LRWAVAVKQAVGHPIGLLQCSLGGSALKPWNPAESEDHPLFDIMRDVVKAVGGRVCGVLWYQGCSDTQPGAAATYLARFTKAVAAWRRILAIPDLPVITVQLNIYAPENDPGVDDAAWSNVREAQRQAARRIRNVAVVPSFGATLSDLIHNSPAGNLVIAERCARAALGMVYGRRIAWRAPEPRRTKIDVSRRTITIVFDNVHGRFRPTESSLAPFRVEDADGVVPLESVGYSGEPTIRLNLARPAVGRVRVHGAYGHHPASVPVDMTRGMPMLGFSVNAD
jgi:hypothetical protein